jgi:hypothetical protein
MTVTLGATPALPCPFPARAAAAPATDVPWELSSPAFVTSAFFL